MERGIGGQLLWDAVKGVKGLDASFVTTSRVISVHQARGDVYALATVTVEGHSSEQNRVSDEPPSSQTNARLSGTSSASAGHACRPRLGIWLDRVYVPHLTVVFVPSINTAFAWGLASFNKRRPGPIVHACVSCILSREQRVGFLGDLFPRPKQSRCINASPTTTPTAMPRRNVTSLLCFIPSASKVLSPIPITSMP